MYWGQQKVGQWRAQQANFNQSALPKYILAQNEPDVPSQSNENPWQAADNWIRELQPYQRRGVKVSSPAIVWNTWWMDSFLDALKRRGATPDFIAIHWYGAWWDRAGFKTWVETVRKRYGMNIWVTEWGVTTSSNGTSQQVAGFVEDTVLWMQNQTYIDRAAWFGAFDTHSPPDSFGAPTNAFWWPGGSLTDVAKTFFFNNGTSMTGMSKYQGQSSY